MFTVAFAFRRKPGLSRDEFEVLYEAHRQVMLREARGLVSYVQHRTLATDNVGGIPCDSGFDALSVYTYRSEADAAHTSRLAAVAADSERFIDFSSMVTLALSAHVVCPE